MDIGQAINAMAALQAQNQAPRQQLDLSGLLGILDQQQQGQQNQQYQNRIASIQEEQNRRGSAADTTLASYQQGQLKNDAERNRLVGLELEKKYAPQGELSEPPMTIREILKDARESIKDQTFVPQQKPDGSMETDVELLQRAVGALMEIDRRYREGEQAETPPPPEEGLGSMAGWSTPNIQNFQQQFGTNPAISQALARRAEAAQPQRSPAQLQAILEGAKRHPVFSGERSRALGRTDLKRPYQASTYRR